jgi:hypothetical protein
MPKLARNFVQGKMNKDLDERLVPPGQYRDAQNIQVVNSEGSDVGAVENILGNTKQNNKPGGGTWQTTGSGTTPFGLTNAKCIGTVRDSQNEKIYWFLTSDTADAILEYDQTANIVSPILVDLNGVLNFSANYLITGVNILDGILYWTDGLNEPRTINIDDFKAGSSQGASLSLVNHTQVYGRNFISKDTTVMVEAPQQILNAQGFASIYSGPGTGITPVTTASTQVFVGKEIGDSVGISWTGAITWTGLTNPQVVLTGEVEQEDGTIDKYQITGTLSSIATISALLSIDSISADIPSVNIVWSMLLIEDDPIYKDDFPRFSYRYKYTDNRYSVYAPFSLPAFVPGKFKYLSRDGNNQGMESVMRRILVDNFPAIPKNVEEVEVLYKGVASNNVYVIETFAYDFTDAQQPVLQVDITSTLLGPIIESVQLLRLYDNVPRSAKAQEIIANRIIYGNYLANYDVSPNSTRISANASNTSHSNIGYGLASVKTNRQYQVGVAFIDELGRQSPVFTSNGGDISFSGKNSQNVNTIEASILANTPALISNGGWASYYKYYIKSSTPEYYNIALDRYYTGIDGSIWLSFPSSERNKLQEGKYITLKKQHDTSIPVFVNNKYKILDISNEVPLEVSTVESVKAKVTGRANPTATIGFIAGDNVISFLAPIKDKNTAFFDSITSDSYIAFKNSYDLNETYHYPVKEGGPIGAEYTDSNGVVWAYFQVTLDENIKTEDSWLSTLGSLEIIKIISYEKDQKTLPEFQGRFFVKVSANASLLDNIKSAFSNPDKELEIDKTLEIDPTNANVVDNSFYVYFDNTTVAPALTLPTQGSNSFIIRGADVNWGASAELLAANYKFRTYNKFIAGGVKFKFKYANGSLSQDYYTVINSSISATSAVQNIIEQVVTLTLDRNFDDTQYSGAPDKTQIDKIVLYREKLWPDQLLLTSDNPAIFETEPNELADLEIYWEASEAISQASAGTTTELDWFNCYSFGNGVESDRIRDDFNAPLLGNGVRVNAELKEPYEAETMGAGLIYSGLYNNISGVNNTNQFLIAEKITKELDPSYGTIQKLHARDTNLVALAEDKVFRIFADKDALYNADGSANLTSTNRVLGEASTFAGEFGISKNPESFASYGFRAYFTDKARGAVLRLSMDGLTDISRNGMTDYFQDELKAASGGIIGAYDENIGTYNIALSNESVSFMENINGWTTRLSYSPEFAASLNNEYYTFQNGEIWEHSNQIRSSFYGIREYSTVTPIFNDAPSSIKNFKTLSYEGDAGWTADVLTDQQDGEVEAWKTKENLYFNYIKGKATTLSNIDTGEFSVQGLGNVLSHDPGSTIVVINGKLNVSLQKGDIVYSYDPGNTLRVIGTVHSVNQAGNFIRFTSTIAGAPPANGNFMLFAKDSEKNTSGIIGYHASVEMKTTSSDKKELFAVNSEVFISSE